MDCIRVAISKALKATVPKPQDIPTNGPYELISSPWKFLVENDRNELTQ